MSFLTRMFARLFGLHDDADVPTRLPSPDELVVVAMPSGEPEAEMLREILGNEGVRAMVRNRDAATARGAIPGPWWGYELLVMRKDAARARAILGDGDDPE
jgi:hypothetical protein